MCLPFATIEDVRKAYEFSRLQDFLDIYAVNVVGAYQMENYIEAFREEFRWATNWKVLAENFMESYHLPVCHAGTIGGHVDLLKMSCPEGLPAFNYHSILKNDALDLAGMPIVIEIEIFPFVIDTNFCGLPKNDNFFALWRHNPLAFPVEQAPFSCDLGLGNVALPSAGLTDQECAVALGDEAPV